MRKNIAVLVFGLFLIFAASAAYAQNSVPAEGVETTDDLSAFTPQIEVTQNIYKMPEDTDALGSAIQPLKVYNPYGAAGQPVVVEFTLSNIGSEYPFNQISLPPDAYALIMAVDKDLGVVLCKEKDASGLCRNAEVYDVWADMSALEQVSYAMGLGMSQLVSEVGGELEGKTCRYVDIYANLPASVKDRIKARNDGKPPDGVYVWDCLTIVDEPFFNSAVRRYCGDQITNACISELNKEVQQHTTSTPAGAIGGTVVGGAAGGLLTGGLGTVAGAIGGLAIGAQGDAVASAVPVVLSATVPKGTCIRPAFQKAQAGDVVGVFGDVVLARENLVVCGIGENGLQPNESVTFRFMVLIPADAPVVPTEELANLTSINEGITQSPSCVGSEFPENCHSIYAAVAPINKTTFLTTLRDIAGSIPQRAGGVISALWNLDLDAFTNYTQTQHNLAVGKPIWRGQGTFYVLGAQLQGDLVLFLWAAFISGAVTSSIIRRKTGAGAAVVRA